MSDESSAKSKIVLVLLVWFAILSVIVTAWKYWYAPRQEKIEKKEVVEKTGSASKFKYDVNLALDSFSGYAILRSDEFKTQSGAYGINITTVDDGANYDARLKALSDGSCQMAAFTVDALIKSSSKIGEMPATIILVIDETKGADAMVAPKIQFPSIDSLNSPDVRIVCTPNSPSETLGRVVMSYFNMENLSQNPFEFVDGAEAVYNIYKRAGPNEKKVFVLWEPYVSRVLENPDYHVLLDSGKFKGYVVDVLVVNRNFLIKNKEVVENVVKAYLASSFKLRNDMVSLVAEDAKRLGQPLTPEQAKRLTETIWWKNTQENYGHFGQTFGTGIQHLDQICNNITVVLKKTGAVDKDPTNGQPNLWYYDEVVRGLFTSSWYPGIGDEKVREEKSLKKLSDEEWSKLCPVGTLEVPRLIFRRGTAGLSEGSCATLDDLVQKLTTWPHYYLFVRGNASRDGDVQANTQLAKDRAQAAVDYLVSKGVDPNRIRAETAEPNGSTTVSFVVGQTSY